jgi:hypothetical protein
MMMVVVCTGGLNGHERVVQGHDFSPPFTHIRSVSAAKAVFGGAFTPRMAVHLWESRSSAHKTHDYYGNVGYLRGYAVL